MSLVSFTSHKQGVQDLFAALPAPASTSIDRSRSEAPRKDAKPGFNDLLRDSSEAKQVAKRSESPEPVDRLPRSEPQQDEKPATTEKSEKVDRDTQASDASGDAKQSSSEDSASDQTNAEASADTSENQVKDTSEEAQLQAAANAVSAQLDVVEATQTNQTKAQAQAVTNEQIDAAKSKVMASGDKSVEQGQANVSKLSLNAALPTQAQSPNGPTVQADAVATVQPVLQQGANTQTSSGDTQGDSKSTTSVNIVNTTASTNSNAAAITAFTVPDQVSGEARLPISTTPTAQSVDASRQVQAQAQAALNTSDNDSLNTARITRGLANAVQQRGGAVTLRLTPPEMGTVRIQMQITGTSISASFHAESSSAQTLLTNQLAQLRSALESKGMSVDRLTVQPLATTTASQNANQSQNQSQNDAQQQGQGQQHSAGDGRSRGQYSGDSSRQQSSDSQQDNRSGQQAPRGFFDSLSDASEEQAA